MSDKGVCVRMRVCACACVCSYEMPMWLIIDIFLFYLLATSVRNDQEEKLIYLFRRAFFLHHV